MFRLDQTVYAAFSGVNQVDNKILPSSVLMIRSVRPQRDMVERIKKEIHEQYERRRSMIESEREEEPAARNR